MLRLRCRRGVEIALQTCLSRGVEFAVLGPVEVRIDGRAAPLGGPKQRALLAMLLLDANQVAWGVGTISGGDHGIPTSFSGMATDLTTGTVLFSFSQAKGNGNGMHNEPTITCTQTNTATAGDLGIPGLNPTDIVQFDLTVTVVLKTG
jgi:hypothetical protein